MRTYLVALSLLLPASWAGAAEEDDPGHELREHLRGTTWQWDGGGGEVVVFGDNGYVDHEGWTQRGLVTRWDVIDKRTALLRIERGRADDLYAVLVFKDDLSSYEGFNFHGGARLKTSTRLQKKGDGPNRQVQGIDR
jgi:hypothetical protein